MKASRLGTYRKSERKAQLEFVRSQHRKVRARRALRWIGVAAPILGAGLVIFLLRTCGGR